MWGIVQEERNAKRVASRNEALRGSGFPSRPGHGSAAGGARQQKEKGKQAELERSMDLAGETKPFLSGVPDLFIKYEVAHPPKARRKRVEVVK